MIEDGLLILQYADDLMLFLEHDIEQAMNIKLLLCTFEQLLGLKIHFRKSEIFCLGWQNSVKVSIYIYSIAN